MALWRACCNPTPALLTWIEDLRDRLARGELAGLAPLDLNGLGYLPGELVVRITLSDLDDLDDPVGSWGGAVGWRDARRWHLLGDFKRLRDLLG